MTQLILCELEQPEKTRLLWASDWAGDFNAIQMETLAHYFKFYSALSNIPILKEGEKNDCCYLLCEGKVDVVKENDAGKLKILQTLGSGKVMGELSFFDGAPCSASVVTKTEIKLLALHKKDFEVLCSEVPGVALIMALNLIKNMSQRIRQTTGELIDKL